MIKMDFALGNSVNKVVNKTHFIMCTSHICLEGIYIHKLFFWIHFLKFWYLCYVEGNVPIQMKMKKGKYISLVHLKWIIGKALFSQLGANKRSKGGKSETLYSHEQ